MTVTPKPVFNVLTSSEPCLLFFLWLQNLRTENFLYRAFNLLPLILPLVNLIGGI